MAVKWAGARRTRPEASEKERARGGMPVGRCVGSLVVSSGSVHSGGPKLASRVALAIGWRSGTLTGQLWSPRHSVGRPAKVLCVIVCPSAVFSMELTMDRERWRPTANEPLGINWDGCQAEASPAHARAEPDTVRRQGQSTGGAEWLGEMDMHCGRHARRESKEGRAKVRAARSTAAGRIRIKLGCLPLALDGRVAVMVLSDFIAEIRVFYLYFGARNRVLVVASLFKVEVRCGAAVFLFMGLPKRQNNLYIYDRF
jgi:hypothetical protein